MNPERWAQIEELFHRAAECDPKQRASLLGEACNGDEELRQAVEKLLVSEEGARSDLKAAVSRGVDAVTFPLVGKTVSHYRVLGGVGGGGMGLVYRAEDVKLGRQVALKFLPEESAKDQTALRRFEREARSASALEHPNICPIYEFGDHEGQPFIVMQLLEGQTLRELISTAGPGKAAFAFNKLLDLAVQTVEGLEAAHNHGIIHRDIKPANIFITKQGQAKILDFGLAKLSGGVTAEDEAESRARNSNEKAEAASDSPSLATPDLLLSRTGVAMGTAGYMSPEQARGEKLDARTDLFSFGLVLYEMATGQRAFKGDTGPALHDAILSQTPAPVRQLNRKLPSKLEAILRKALEKKREARYQTASELRTDLQILMREIEPSNRVVRREVALGVVAAVLIMGVSLWYLKHKSLSPTAAPVLKLRQLTINSGENGVNGGAISPDGKYLAYADQKGMHLKLIETGELRSIPEPDDFKDQNVDWEVVSSGWFPDSSRFLANAHLSDSGANSPSPSLWMVSGKDWALRKLRDNAGAYSVSPDGSLISFGTNKGRLGPREIWLMRSNGEEARKLFETDENSSIGGLLWAPDGQRVIYVRSDESGDTFVTRSLNGGPLKTLFTPSETKNITDGLWSRDGRFIYSVREPDTQVETCNYWMARLDARSGERLGKPMRLTNQTGLCMNSSSATSDGKQLIFQGFSGHGTVYTADLEVGGTRISNPRHFTLDESGNYPQGWTPDSQTLLFTSSRSGNLAIYKQALNEDSPELIAGGAVGFRQARVSPDGKWIMAFLYPKPGSPTDPDQLMRVPISGGSPELIFKTSPVSEISCVYPSRNLCVVVEASTDNKQCIVTAFDPVQGRGRELAQFDIDPNEHQWYCEISPDGTRFAVSPGPQGPLRVLSLHDRAAHLVPFKDLKIYNSDLAWAADGNGFYVSTARKGGTVLLHLDLQGHTKVLWENRGGNFAYGIPSPDGHRIAILGNPVTSNMWMMENF